MNKKPLSLQVDLDDFILATDAEKEYMVQMRPSSTFFKDGLKRLLKNKVATVCFFMIVVIALTSIFLPMFWPYSYDAQLGITPGKPVDASYNNLAPFEYGKTELKKIEAGEEVFPHIFGTDSAGRDYFISVVIISTALQIPSAIFTESYLSFLGLGVNAPMPSLGSLASDALNGLSSYPHRLAIPAVVISLIVLSLNLFGDGLRDAFDPKLNA